MAYQRRSTSGTLSRILAVVVLVAAVLILARLCHALGVLTSTGYYNDTGYVETPVSFWHMTAENTNGGWIGIGVLHLVSFLTVVIAYLIVLGLYLVVEWVLFKPKPEPSCADKHCTCIKHKGKHFRSDGNYWSNTSKEQDNAAVTVAVVAGSTAAAVGIISNS